MAKLYSGDDVAAFFRPMTVTQPRVPIRDMDKEPEKAVYLKEIRVKVQLEVDVGVEILDIDKISRFRNFMSDFCKIVNFRPFLKF